MHLLVATPGTSLVRSNAKLQDSNLAADRLKAGGHCMDQMTVSTQPDHTGVVLSKGCEGLLRWSAYSILPSHSMCPEVSRHGRIESVVTQRGAACNDHALLHATSASVASICSSPRVPAPPLGTNAPDTFRCKPESFEMSRGAARTEAKRLYLNA